MRTELKRIGVVGGADMETLIGHLDDAARGAGVELMARSVASDKAALHAFRAMLPQLDGFVLMPDARVLSPTAIRRMITQAQRNDVPMLVYSRAMYDLGAELYIRADADDAARQIGRLLSDSGLQTLPLTDMEVYYRGRLRTAEAG